jgi:peroxiredoxin 2/4
MKKRLLFMLVLFLSATSGWSQKSGENRIPLIGEKAPAFTAETTNGLLNFPADFGKNWKILFSHPRDFTPVCTSEVLQLSRMQEEFDELGVKIAIISTDQVSEHFKWKKSIEEIEVAGKDPVQIRFPFIDDSKTEVSRLYGMVHEESTNVKDVRGVFIIDADNVIQTILFYPMKVGRNMEEIKRTVEALQTVNAHVSTPVNWKPGDDVLVPVSPYLNPELKDTTDIMKQYYKIGTVMWYKKMSANGSL